MSPDLVTVTGVRWRGEVMMQVMMFGPHRGVPVVAQVAQLKVQETDLRY